MKKLTVVIILLSLFTLCRAQIRIPKEIMRQMIKENYAFADTQNRYMMTLTPADKMPQTYDEKVQN